MLAAARITKNLFREERTMLVLSRKVGERLVIGDNVTVVVNKVAGNRVTLGVEAPDDVRIIRGELEIIVRDFEGEAAEAEAEAEAEEEASQCVAAPIGELHFETFLHRSER
jgi:carbon storage regulator